MWSLIKIFSFLMVLVFTIGFNGCYSQNHNLPDIPNSVPLIKTEPPLPQEQVNFEPPIPQQSLPPENSLDAKIGQMLIVGFRGMYPYDQGVKDIIRDIQHFHLGGIILFDYDVALKSQKRNIQSRNQLRQLIVALQSAATIAPLFIAIDQEGGKIRRLKEKFGFSADPFSAQYLGTQGISQTKKQASQIANTLAEVGINFNFAPVVDLNTNPNNPVIGKLGRSFSDDPQLVSKHALTFISEHNKKGILCVLKHFPGHGSSHHDSHLGWVDVSDSWDESELVPYQNLLNAGIESKNAIMVGHLFNEILDPKYPATLSKEIIGRELRTDLGYNGVVVSDDMQMKAISRNYSFEEAIYRTIDAGIDIIVIGNNLTYERNVVAHTITIIKQLLQSGRISPRRVEESYQRIQKLKSQLTRPFRTFNQVSQKPYKLMVKVIPFGSQIRIMNIVPKYYPGIKLFPGDYHIRVENPGYITHNEWVTIQNRDIAISVELQRK